MTTVALWLGPALATYLLLACYCDLFMDLPRRYEHVAFVALALTWPVTAAVAVWRWMWRA